MKQFTFLLLGVFFGILMYMSEAASWFRIFEMFHFQSFHMYGIIGSAVGLGVIAVAILKKMEVTPADGSELSLKPKDKSIPRYLFGGILFGLGWALAGACPGPMYTLLGTGMISIAVLIFGALLGTYVYGLLRHRLPH